MDRSQVNYFYREAIHNGNALNYVFKFHNRE